MRLRRAPMFAAAGTVLAAALTLVIPNAFATPPTGFADTVVARRGARGGRSAAEHLVAALRCLYGRAVADGYRARRQPGVDGGQAAPGSCSVVDIETSQVVPSDRQSSYQTESREADQ
jgi:hypothetical protein